MRVAHINSFGRYSTGNIAGNILSNLETDEKLLIYGRDGSDYNFAKKINTKMGAFSHVILNKLFGGQGRHSSINTKKIIKELEKFKPDIIHLHNLHGYYINYEMLFNYIKKKGVKTVWTLHDCWAFTGYCTHYDYINCDKWEEGCSNCPLYNKEGYKTLFDTSKKEYNHKKKAFLGVKDLTIVVPSHWLETQVKKSFLKDYPIQVINNGIDTEIFKYVDNHTYDSIINRDNKVILGVASNFGAKKGYYDFLQLSTILPNNYQIVMVGLSKDTILELPSNIIGIEKTKNQSELAELYSLADVYVNLTYEDTFPTTNLEALACGTPVVTYNTGGSVETVDNQNGLVVNKGDIKNILVAVETILNGEYNHFEIAKAAQNKYKKEDMVKKYQILYEQNENK